MEKLICSREGCNNPVPESRRLGAKFCRDWCGSTHRNREKQKSEKEKRSHSRKLDQNYKIIKDLYKKGVYDVSIESLELLGFDFDYCTGVDDFNSQTGIMKFNLFEFQIIFLNNRCKISKLSS